VRQCLRIDRRINESAQPGFWKLHDILLSSFDYIGPPLRY
jgi:hypothetical protein